VGYRRQWFAKGKRRGGMVVGGNERIVSAAEEADMKRPGIPRLGRFHPPSGRKASSVGKGYTAGDGEKGPRLGRDKFQRGIGGRGEFGRSRSMWDQ